MKSKIFMIIIFLLVTSIYGQNNSANLERILVDGKWGYINSEGSVIVLPVYDYGYPFENGFTVVIKDTNGQPKRAYLNSQGELITDFIFDSAYYFYGDLARVKIGEFWGYIDKKGKLVVDCLFSRASNFDYGIGVVKRDGITGVVLKDGTVKEFPYYSYIRFYNGLGKFYIDKMYGLIDTNGSVITAARFEKINLGENTIVVKYKGKYGTIGMEGNAIIDPLYDSLYESSTSGILVFKQNNKYGLIKSSGEIIVSLENNRIINFYGSLMEIYENRKSVLKGIDASSSESEGFESLYKDTINGKTVYRVKQNGLFGLLDDKNRWLVEPKYEYISSFSDSFAVVNKDGLYGYIDYLGEEVITPQFAAAYGFSEGLAVVQEDSGEIGLKGYINKKGIYEIKPQFDWAYSFNNGIAHIAFGDYNFGTFGYINKDGEFISPARN